MQLSSNKKGRDWLVLGRKGDSHSLVFVTSTYTHSHIYTVQAFLELNGMTDCQKEGFKDDFASFSLSFLFVSMMRSLSLWLFALLHFLSFFLRSILNIQYIEKKSEHYYAYTLLYYVPHTPCRFEQKKEQ